MTVILVLLGALAILSATWTIGAPRESLRWGLVILAYGAIALSAGTVVGRGGPWVIAVGLAGLAALEATIGLGAAALHALPDAERIGGSWRPGGNFQYPPSLGLLEVAVLPALLGALGRRPSAALLAAFGAALAGAVLGCVDSRLDLALGAIVLILAVVWPPIEAQGRAEVVAAAGMVVVAAIGAHLVLGRHVPPGVDGNGLWRLTSISSWRSDHCRVAPNPSVRSPQSSSNEAECRSDRDHCDSGRDGRNLVRRPLGLTAHPGRLDSRPD